MNSQSVRGFTLPELSIVLVILGVLLAGGARMFASVQRSTTEKKLHAETHSAAHAVIGAARAEGGIPLTFAAFSEAAGMPVDTFNRPYHYIPAPDFTGSSGELCSRVRTSLSAAVCNNAACTDTTAIDNIAFAIISGGADRNIQTDASANVITVPYAGENSVDAYPADGDQTAPYDDAVEFVTLSSLRVQAGCTRQALKVLQAPVKNGIAGSELKLTFYAEGGVPDASGRYRWCVESSPLPGGLASSYSSFNCSLLPEFLWQSTETFTLNAPEALAGSHSIKVYVRDFNDPTGGNDAVAHRTVVFTVSGG